MKVRYVWHRIAACFALLLGLVCHVQVGAAEAWPYRQSGNQTTYTADGMRARFNSKYVWDVDPDGKIRATGIHDLPTGGGRSIPVTGKAFMTGASLAGVFLKMAARSFGPLGVGIMLWDIANDLDFSLTRKSDGDIDVKYRTEGCDADCKAWSTSFTGAGRYPSPEDAWAAAIVAAYGSGWTLVSVSLNGPGTVASASMYKASYGYLSWSSFATKVDVPPSATYRASTLQELADRIASESGWPSASKIPEMLRDAATADVPFEIPAPSSLTGPATSPGVVTTSVTNVGGDTITTTQTTTNNHNYAGNTVTNVITTVTTTHNATTNVTTTDKTETKEPEKPDVSECEKNPNSLGCAEADTPDGEIPRAQETITFESEDSFGSGSCPSDITATIVTGGLGSRKVWDWSALCGYALPVRGLVLLLATFAAFLIVVPGGPRT